MVKIVHSSGMNSGILVGLAAGLGKMGYDAHKKAQAKREEEEAAAAEEAEVEARQQELRQMLAYEGAPTTEAAVGPTGPVLQQQAAQPFDLRTDPVFMEQVAGLPKEKRDLMMYLAETKYQGERDQQARAHVRNMLEMGGELLQNDMEGVQMIVEGMEAGLIDAPQAAEAIQDKISQANLKMARVQVAQQTATKIQQQFGGMLEAADGATQQEAYALLADIQAGVVPPDEAQGEMFRIMAGAFDNAAKAGRPAPQFGAMSPATDGSVAGEGGETEPDPEDQDVLDQLLGPLEAGVERFDELKAQHGSEPADDGGRDTLGHLLAPRGFEAAEDRYQPPAEDPQRRERMADRSKKK